MAITCCSYRAHTQLTYRFINDMLTLGLIWLPVRVRAQTQLTYNFINDMLTRTKLVLRYDLRLIGAAAIHLGLAAPKCEARLANVRAPPCLCSLGRSTCFIGT